MTAHGAKQAIPSKDLLSQLRKHSKGIADVGQNMLSRLSKQSVSRLTDSLKEDKVIDMKKNTAVYSSADGRQNPHALFRQQLPSLTQQLLGKRFHSLNKIGKFIVPNGSFDIASDQILELLADFASNLAESRKVLDEAGVATLAELQHDVARSGRLARALGEQNRIVGIVQGALSGALGVVGAAADLPFSMIIALKTVYLTGRAYGFELDQPEDRALVYEALSKVDLTLVAEKQAIFLGLRSFSNLLDSGDLKHLQSLVGSHNNIEPLRNFLSDETGQLKWKLSPAIISKIAPLIGGAAGAIYNARFIEEVATKAQEVFSQARQQVIDQAKVTPSAVSPVFDKPVKTPNENAQLEAQVALLQNETIEKVDIESKAAIVHPDEVTQDSVIHDKIEELAEQLIASPTPAAKPRVRKKPVATAAATSVDTKSAAATEASKPKPAAEVKASRPRTPAKTPQAASNETTKVDDAKPTPRRRTTKTAAKKDDSAE